MAKASQYLEWHGQQYRVRVKVPARLRGLVGKGKLLRPLHTDSLKEANQRKWPIVAAMKAEIAAAERILSTADPQSAEALHLRHRLETERQVEYDQIVNAGAALADTRGWDAQGAELLYVASAAATPIVHHLDAFLRFNPSYRQKTVSDLRRCLSWLEQWLKDRDKPPFVEDIDRRVAAEFIEDFLARGRSHRKATAYLSSYRSYWKWLVRRGHVEENPWLNQDVPAEPRPVTSAELDRGKRPYTNDELTRLLSGPATGYLPDLMRIAALSGMRIEEICQLRVSDCVAGCFRIRSGKTAKAERDVPIHMDLYRIVETRSLGKERGDYLIHELPETPTSRDTRSDPASKRFTRYRREVGVDERPNGKAKSNVDFHSFRRWFIREARDRLNDGAPGYSPWVIADVVGHDDKALSQILSLTMGGYPGVSSEAARRACIEAVRLPDSLQNPDQ